jgi:hypothetical protein
MTLEEALLEDAAQKISDDIDQQVLRGVGYVFDFYLEYSTGKVFGHDYLTVAPMNAEGMWSDMMAWMVETFGPLDDSQGVFTPNQRWYANNAKFWFRDQKDRDWFVLRWS